jgi:TonB family protein
MKTKTLAYILILLVASVSIARAGKQADPVPFSVLKYQGEDLPLYDAKDVRPLHSVPPRYPDAEKKKGIEGEVTLLLLVDVDGKVVDAAVKDAEKPSPFGEAARESALKWTYPKFTKDGKPTRYMVRTRVVFQIS